MQPDELKEAFIKMISEHSGIIHKIRSIYCHHDEDKKNMMQETTLQLWRSFPGFRGQSKFRTWMYRVAINTAVSNIRRSMKDAVKIPLVKSEIENTSEQKADCFDQGFGQLHLGISRLNDIEKAIILLYLEEPTCREIADIVGISEKNGSVKLGRTNKKLQPENLTTP